MRFYLVGFSTYTAPIVCTQNIETHLSTTGEVSITLSAICNGSILNISIGFPLVSGEFGVKITPGSNM